jgi:uncharacterized protein
MSSREFDPFRLPVEAFAKESGTLEGDWPLSQFGRLPAMSLADGAPGPQRDVKWRARGELRALRGGERQPWLHLTASACLVLECQRCLQPVELAIEVARSFLFVHGEEAAAQLDAESEDDVLPLTRALDLHELIEDELLLALPIVPRHDVCPQPLPSSAAAEAEPAAANPFAALAGLKRGGPLN